MITARQAYILSWTIRYPGRSMLWMYPSGFWRLNRAYEYYADATTRNPSDPEGKRLLELGLISLRYDLKHYTENTITNERRMHSRAVITPKGRKALEEFNGSDTERVAAQEDKGHEVEGRRAGPQARVQPWSRDSA